MNLNDDWVLIWIDELSTSDFVSLFGRPNCSRTSARTMYKICLKISRLYLKFWTIAISYSMFQQSKLTHRMLNWHQTDRPSATINYNLSPTTILPRDLITFQLSHIATASYSIDQSASSHRASWPTECWPEITLTGLAPQSTRNHY